MLRVNVEDKIIVREEIPRKNRFNRLYSNTIADVNVITAPVFGVASLRCGLQIRSQKSKRFFLAKTGKKEIILNPLYTAL